MDEFLYPRDYVTVHCPVCKKKLGAKHKDEIKGLECKTEGCSQTKHYFYPGQIKRPGKSIPWASYYEEKSRCGKPCCDPTPDSKDLSS